jgi:glycosyltransferase involved in cell wall biosynthesis
MFRRSRILLLVPHLGGGGAERVMAQLAQSLPCERFDVHLGLITKTDDLPEALPPNVRVHRVGARRLLFGTFGLLRMIWRLRPDLILSGMFHLNLLVLLLRPLFPRQTRILIRQNGMLLAQPSNIVGFPLLRLYRAAYPQAEGIICQTQAMAAEMTGLLGSKAKIFVLRNPVDVSGVRRAVARSPRRWVGCGPHLLAVGRLSAEKGFDLLLDAFAIIRPRFPEADLAILGKGPEEESLRTQCESLGLSACVQFAGYVVEPASWFAGASLLVISSRHDAFPNALLEAAAAGLPVVATPCSPGVTELLRGKSGAWLARQVSSEALARSMQAALITLYPGERFRHSWLEPYDLQNAVREYETLIRQTLAGVGP